MFTNAYYLCRYVLLYSNYKIVGSKNTRWWGFIILMRYPSGNVMTSVPTTDHGCNNIWYVVYQRLLSF